MCEIKDGFKLCTCDGKKPITEPYWELERANPNIEPMQEMGRCIFPSYDLNERELQKKIEEELRRGRCFDFDYTPQENDWLYIKHDKKSKFGFTYRFHQGQWHIDESGPFVLWKSQLEPYLKGKLV